MAPTKSGFDIRHKRPFREVVGALQPAVELCQPVINSRRALAAIGGVGLCDYNRCVIGPYKIEISTDMQVIVEVVADVETEAPAIVDLERRSTVTRSDICLLVKSANREVPGLGPATVVTLCHGDGRSQKNQYGKREFTHVSSLRIGAACAGSAILLSPRPIVTC